MDEGGSINEGAAPAGASLPATGPRFPWAAALFCAACVGAAVWTWIRYSCALEVTTQDFDSKTRDVPTHRLVGRYVRLRPAREAGDGWVSFGTFDDPPQYSLGGSIWVPVIREEGQDFPAVAEGRVVVKDTLWPYLAVDATASRFTGASVAGLVVGAMGVFVFALHLRHWLKERRPGGAAPDAPC